MGSIFPYRMVKNYVTKWSKKRAAKNWAAFPLSQYLRTADGRWPRQGLLRNGSRLAPNVMTGPHVAVPARPELCPDAWPVAPRPAENHIHEGHEKGLVVTKWSRPSPFLARKGVPGPGYGGQSGSSRDSSAARSRWPAACLRTQCHAGMTPRALSRRPTG